MSRSVFSVLVLASALILPSPGTAQIEGQGDYLRGLTGISIAVRGVTEEAERDGVDTARVRTVVELVLRSAGIRLFTFDELHQEHEANPRFRRTYLDVYTLTLHRSEGSTVVYCVKVNLRESLLTDGQQVVEGVIWGRDVVRIVGRIRLRETIIDDFRSLAEMFANDYLKANPRNR